MKKSKKLFFEIEAFIFFLVALSFTILSGCSDSVTNSTVTASTHPAMVEKQFVLSPGLKALAGAVITVDLEDLNSPATADDTGPIGEDIIPYSYATTAEHRFEIGSESNFKIKMVNDSSRVTLFELNSASSIIKIIPAGNYKLHLISLENYSASDTKSNVVFIQPNKETSFTSSLSGGYNPDDLNTLLKTGKCKYCNLEDANLSKMNLKKIELLYCGLNNANFSESDLDNARMTNNDVFNVNFTRANISGVDFRGSKLLGLTMTKTKAASTDFSGTRFHSYNMDSCYIILADFSNCNLEGMKITGGQVLYSKFSNAKFTGITDLEFNGTEFINSDFSNAKISGTSFLNCRLNSVNFSNADLSNSNLSYSNIVSANFCGALKNNISATNVIYNSTTQCWP